jgi:hypothetical protein
MPIGPPKTLISGSASFGNYALARCPQWGPRPDSTTYESTISVLTSALDRAAQATVAPWTDKELAVRLARLIWNAEPDQPLSDAAAKDSLHDARALRSQARRMLADPRSTALVTGFFGAWLSLDQLTTMKWDGKLFPEFDDELRGAFRRKTELFVESQLREDRSPLDLWTANYTFLNERLARHYGIPNVSGSEYRRVTWPGPERAGLLAQGSILTLTSYPYNAYHRRFRNDGRRNHVQRPRRTPSSAAGAWRRFPRCHNGTTHGVRERRYTGGEPTHSIVPNARRPRRAARSRSPESILGPRSSPLS